MRNAAGPLGGRPFYFGVPIPGLAPDFSAILGIGRTGPVAPAKKHKKQKHMKMKLPNRRPGGRREAAVSPPQLSPSESRLEQKLGQLAHPAHAKAPWHQRTREYSRAWDQARRRYTGVLTTYFRNFTPLWQRPDWRHFNQARRDADAAGAHYDHWVEFHFQRMSKSVPNDFSPRGFYGRQARQAFREAAGWECRPDYPGATG